MFPSFCYFWPLVHDEIHGSHRVFRQRGRVIEGQLRESQGFLHMLHLGRRSWDKPAVSIGPQVTANLMTMGRTKRGSAGVLAKVW